MAKSSNNQVLTGAHRDFSRGLLRYANLKVNNAALSEDLVQTTFMKTWLYLHGKGNIDLMRAFLYHTLNALIIDEYRKRKVLSLDLLTENGLEFEAINSEDIYNIIDGKVLAVLIAKFPERYKDIITLRFTKELTLKEISGIKHQTENTTSAQVHRGLLKLRVLYAASGV